MDDIFWLLLVVVGIVFVVLLYIGCIIFGVCWYVFFGVGEWMVWLFCVGYFFFMVIIIVIIVVLVLWMVYVFLVVGWLLVFFGCQEVLVLIIVVFGVCGLVGLLIGWVCFGCNGVCFWYISLVVCLMLVGFYLVGSVQVWMWL